MDCGGFASGVHGRQPQSLRQRAQLRGVGLVSFVRRRRNRQDEAQRGDRGAVIDLGDDRLRPIHAHARLRVKAIDLVVRQVHHDAEHARIALRHERGARADPEREARHRRAPDVRRIRPFGPQEIGIHEESVKENRDASHRLHLRDQFDLHARAERCLRDAEGAARVRAGIAEELEEQLRRAVGNEVLFGE